VYKIRVLNPFLFLVAFVSLALILHRTLGNLREIRKLQQQFDALSPKREENFEGSYRQAPSIEDPLSAPAPPPPVSKPGPKRKFLEHQGGVSFCPFCNGGKVARPKYFPAECDDNTCRATIGHLHQDCECGATWATYAKA